MLMIMKYHNFNISSEVLRDMTKTTKEGTSAYHIVKTFYKYGFDAKGIKCSINDLENLTLPLIVHTKVNNNYFHFIVVYKVNKKNKTVLIADPANKLKTLTYAEFEDIWTNTIICIQQVVINEQVKNKRILINIIKATKLNITTLLITSSIITIISIINSYYFMLMMNKQNYTLLFLTLVVFKLMFEIIRNNYLIKIKHDLDFNITNETFKRIIDLPYRYYSNRTTGEVISRVNDLELVKNAISKLIFIIFLDLPLTLIAGIFLYNISPTLFASSFIILLMYLGIYFLFSNKIKEKIKEIQEEKEQLNSFMTEMISSYETVKSQNLESKIKAKYQMINQKYLKKIKVFDYLLSKEYHLKETVAGVSQIMIIYLGFNLISANHITISELITFNFILFFFLEPIKNIIEINSEVKETLSAIKRVEELFYEEDLIEDEDVAGGDIAIKNLTYSYNDIENVISNLTIDIKQGEKIMISGKSGIGKSTLLKIIMKYLSDFSGEIKVNNKNILGYNFNNYRKGISYISQKESLFRDTIHNNLYSSNIDKINSVINVCELDEFFSKNNLDTIIDENTFNISGGEKQRLVLMRALLKEFNILIIDEGFSEVDTNTEKKILEKVFEMCKQKTIIVVSHRLENVSLFDRVCNV